MVAKTSEASDHHRNSLLPPTIDELNDNNDKEEGERKSVIFEDGEFKATKNTIKQMLLSFRQMEQKYSTMKVGYDDYRKKADLYKKMMWYWRKQSKQLLHELNNKKQEQQDLSTYETYYFEEHFVNVTDEALLMNLTEEISEQRKNAEHWKSKYTSLKLSKLRTCATIGKELGGLDGMTFSFSNCLMVLGSAIPDLNITTFLEDISKPVEHISEHVNKAWTNLKSQWKKDANYFQHDDDQQDDSAAVVMRNNMLNVKRFRKMFSYGNIVADDTINKYSSGSTGEGQLEPCTKEFFDLNFERPVPCQRKSKKTEASCDHENPLVDLVKERGPRCDRTCYKMTDDDEGRSVEDQLRQEKAKLKAKVDQMVVLFRLYKAKAQSKLAQAKQGMERRINENKTQRKERVKRFKQQKQELRTKIRQLQERRQAKHDEEISALEQQNRDLQNTIQNLEKEKRYWERIERFNMRQNLDDLVESMDRMRAKYEKKIKELRKKFSKYVAEQKLKMKNLVHQKQKEEEKNECQSIKLINDRLQRKLDYYKSRHNHSTMQVEKLKIIVNNAERAQSRKAMRQREQKRRNERQNQKHKYSDFYVVDEEQVLSELPIIPSVYCADQENCMKGDHGIMEEIEEEENIELLPDDKGEPTTVTPQEANVKETTTISSLDVDGKKKFFQITKFEREGELATYAVRSLNIDEIPSQPTTSSEQFPPKPSPPRSLKNGIPSKPTPPKFLRDFGDEKGSMITEENRERSQNISSSGGGESSTDGDAKDNNENEQSKSFPGSKKGESEDATWLLEGLPPIPTSDDEYQSWYVERPVANEGGDDDNINNSWYDEMMKLREEYSEETDKEISKGKNLYFQTIVEREAERTNWYLKDKRDD